MAEAAVFLDRDGTLIEEVGYASRPEQIRILGGAARALADLADAGYRLIVVTNQSGLARGLMTEEGLERFHEALDAQLDMLGVHLDAYYVCPHHPDLQDSPRPDLVVECQGIVSAAGIRGVAAPALPKKLMAGAMVPRWARAEQMVEAVRTGDRELLLVYLLEDPRTRRLEQAESLLAEWLADPRNTRLAERVATG